MGIIGGDLGYLLLSRFYPRGEGVPMPSTSDPDKDFVKLNIFFSEEELQDFRGKTVVDFGCGEGRIAVALALNGAARVIGLDIVSRHFDVGRRAATQNGVSDRVTFATSTLDKADIVLSCDAFEHFGDPAAILRAMREVVADDGYALITFGYTWYHPLGGHLFSVFPWAHLIFTEDCLMRWRSEFKSDGATRFSEVEGGLNQMTIRRWERLVAESPFEIEWQRARPIGPARWLYNRWTREFLTSTLQVKLRPRKR